ncbi:TDP-N-acetylfucosamine:lipid II N-acetylfucosaminyltransferase [Halalkalibaculum sp. DA384]
MHIATDEKFIDTAHNIYEKAFPGKNKFLIIKRYKNQEIEHLSDYKNYHFIFIRNIDERISSTLSKADVIVFHGISTSMLSLIKIIPENTIKIWNVFGFEVYRNPYLCGKELYGKKTYEKFVYSYKKEMKKKIKPFYYKLFKHQKEPYLQLIEVMKGMHYMGILYKEEFEFFKDKIGLRDIKQIRFTYFPIENVLDIQSGVVNGNNILVGNSASYSNNHLEAFEQLKKNKVEDKKIICPLSYGDEAYAEKIIKKGKDLFGSNFKPLKKFLPIREYQKILKSCGLVLMNHYRQQAVGNVLNAIHLGSKVYLNKKNTLYHYLNRIGCDIYSIENDFNASNKDKFNLLEKKKVMKNRKIIEDELSLGKICEELVHKISPLLN